MIFFIFVKNQKMDLQTRKIQFIQEVLRVKNEKIIKKMEDLLHRERKKIAADEPVPMTMDDFNAMIDRAESDAENGRLYNSGEIMKEIGAWQ